MTESQKLEEKLKQMMRFEDNDTLFIRSSKRNKNQLRGNV